MAAHKICFGNLTKLFMNILPKSVWCLDLAVLTCVGAAELWQAEDGQGQQQEEKVIGGQGQHQAVEGSHSWVSGGSLEGHY